jgi:hypothetical protein
MPLMKSVEIPIPQKEQPLLRLTPEDRQQIEILRGANVLKTVEKRQISAPKGFMTFFCPDCDQFTDKIDFLYSVAAHSCTHRRIHPFALNGGGLSIAPDSPISVGRINDQMTFEQAVMVNQIKKAMEMKLLDLLVLGCHAPCGAAYSVPLDFFSLLRKTFEAKRWLKEQIPGLRIAVFPHIDYCEGVEDCAKKRTYSISGKDFWEFVNRERIFAT